MYRTVETGLWDDPDVRPLSPQAKLFFVYLFTNRHGHVSGIYYLLPVTAAAETGLQQRALDTLWHTLSSAGLAWFDRKCNVVFVRSMLRHQGRGEKNQRAAAAQLSTLHNSCLISTFLKEYPEVRPYVSDRVSDRVSGGYLPCTREEQEQEQEQETTPLPPPTRQPKTPAVAAKAAKGVESIPIPQELSSPTFAAAWTDWLSERRARRIKPYTPKGAAGQLARLAKWGATVAIAQIRLALDQGYQGIPEPNGNGGRHGAGELARLNAVLTAPAPPQQLGLEEIRDGARTLLKAAGKTTLLPAVSLAKTAEELAALVAQADESPEMAREKVARRARSVSR